MRARGTQDLTQLLAETAVWIDLRVMLMTALRDKADTGDERARAFIDFVAAQWPGGGVPRQREHTLQEQTINNLRDLVMECIDAIQALGGRRPNVMIERALACGVVLPPHVLEVATGEKENQ